MAFAPFQRAKSFSTRRVNEVSVQVVCVHTRGTHRRIAPGGPESRHLCLLHANTLAGARGGVTRPRGASSPRLALAAGGSLGPSSAAPRLPEAAFGPSVGCNPQGPGPQGQPLSSAGLFGRPGVPAEHCLCSPWGPAYPSGWGLGGTDPSTRFGVGANAPARSGRTVGEMRRNLPGGGKKEGGEFAR